MTDTEIVIPVPLLEDFIENEKPSLPVYAFRPHSIAEKTKIFLETFEGRILYSVKSNPGESVLRALFTAGIRDYDVASISEVRLIDSLFPDRNTRNLYFMHPIKSREAIREAYFNYGVKTYSLDTLEELEKIREETNDAKDLSLHVRLAIPNAQSKFNLSSKFGILPTEVKELLIATREVSKTLGVCFHVGSQCMDPDAYGKAIQVTYEVIKEAGVTPEVLDIGGGFPSRYPTMTPEPLTFYLNKANEAIRGFKNRIGKDCEIWCEPGRALVAESGSLVVRVEARKKNMLYINDGTYGGLFDAGVPGFIYPTKVIRDKDKTALSTNVEAFGFYGPTCDSLDEMKGPFYLPEDIAEGDYIEIGQLGAYSRSIRTEFNGFNPSIEIVVADPVLLK